MRKYKLYIFAPILFLLYLSGCATITAVSSIPNALYGVVSEQFTSEELSVPHSMRATLAATQHSLQEMRLDIDILEIQADGYGINFSKHKLDGKITLRQHTERLTTILVSVKINTREISIEHAIIELITSTLKNQAHSANIQLTSYNALHAKADSNSKQLGWFRPGAMLGAKNSKTMDWLIVDLPSGDKAFLKGNIISSEDSPLNNNHTAAQ